MPAVALTDHGTMHGVIDFFAQAQEAGVKPIIGVEAYLAARGMADRDAKLDKKSFHLLLLAENQTGYQNLLKIASAAQLEGFYYYPRIDRDFLAAHSEGLICTSGCMAAEVPRALADGDEQEARRRLDWYYEVFGPERFFLELQAHEIPELTALNKALLDLGTRYKANYIATNDVHYVDASDARLQDILLAIQTGCVLKDPNRMRMSDNSYYLRSPQEMSALFAEVPQAISNTLLIAERCNVNLKTKGYHLPQFSVPAGYTAESYLRELCEQGLRRKYGARAEDAGVRQRLNYELDVIEKMGFSAYFLIVWDLCRYAREQGIWYGARGSAAGAIVAYTLDITLVEPLAHGLIFERFLNPGRISMPDIDLDFQDDLRHKLLDYTVHKYGDDKVAQIITFGTMGARAAIRDVGRVMDIPIPEVDRVAKTVPNIPGKPITIKEALETVEELKQVYAEARGERSYIKELIDTAAQMEGVVRSVGTHAAGVVIADKPILEYLPLHRPTNNAGETPIKTVTQFEMGILEKLGMLKVDFLGLITLTIMQRACKLIKERHGKDFNLGNIPIDDPATFELMGRGQTAAVFQVEGTGMKRYLTQMKPQNLDNIIAMISLYRPGPLEFIPSYIKRMHGEEMVKYIHPTLEPIFQETYGIPVYQEQIMRAAVDLAGYSMSESDELRKAISKKKKEDLLKHRAKFVSGASERGMPQAAAEGIFTEWEEFARYGFNKCVTGETEIIDASTGRLVRVEDLFTGVAHLSKTISCDEDTLKLRPGRVARVMRNGVKPVFRLTTALGRSIEATANHPFYTLDGWRLLSDLSAGEQIAVPRRLPMSGQTEWPEYEVIALGHLLAEGNLCHPHSVYFYSQDAEQVADYVRAAEQFENVQCSLATHKATFSVYAKRIERTAPPGIVAWAKALGIWGKNARTKEIPAGVFELTNAQMGLLISRMWEGDGHLDLNGRSLYYATASERMARQLQHLLLRLGIISRLRRVEFPYKEGRIGYQVFIMGNHNLKLFAQHIARHFVSAKRQEILETLTLNVVPLAFSTKDVVPVGVKELVRAAKTRAGITWSELSEASGVAPREFYPTGAATKNGFTRQTIARLADYFQDPALRRYADSDVYWDEIISIEYVGEKPTYDLEIPKTHNFIANDILVHNSHAAVYGVISVQTAYLKAHYSAEYMAAALSAYKGSTDNVALYVEDCRALGLEVLPPDVNYSEIDFSIEDLKGNASRKKNGRAVPTASSGIRFGLAAIKNVGESAVQVMLDARAKGGKFTSLDDFCQRVDLRQVGKRALECLIKVGALDALGERAQLLEGLEQVINASAGHFRAEEAGQMTLFGGGGGFAGVHLPKIKIEVPKREQLKWEKELIGLYVSDHPLQAFIEKIRDRLTHFSNQLTEADHDRQVTMAGVVTHVRTHLTKKGDQMAFVTVEDLQGSLDLVLFPKTWRGVSDWLAEEKIIVLHGKVDSRDSASAKILVDRLDQDVTVTLAGTRPALIQGGMFSNDELMMPVMDDELPPSDYVPEPPDEPWFNNEPEMAASPPVEKSGNGHRNSNGNHSVTANGALPALKEAPAAYVSPPAYGSPVSATPVSVTPRRIIITLTASGDRARDRRQLKLVHGKLSSTPGPDQFEFIIHDGDKQVQMRFPNHSTRFEAVRAELEKLVGAEAIQVLALSGA